MPHISTIAELIDSLGGQSQVGDLFGISQSAVANWVLRDQVPPGYHLRLLALISRKGVRVDPSVFGLSAEDAKILEHMQRADDETTSAA